MIEMINTRNNIAKKSKPILKAKTFTNEDRFSLAIISLMRTFLGNYDGYKKIPKTVKRLMNRCENGMIKDNFHNTIAFKDTIDRVNNIYIDAINEFSDKEVYIDMVDTCIRLHSLDSKNLLEKYNITEKDIEMFYRLENIDERGLQENNKTVIGFFAERLYREFNILKPLTIKEKLSKLITKFEFNNSKYEFRGRHLTLEQCIYKFTEKRYQVDYETFKDREFFMKKYKVELSHT